MSSIAVILVGGPSRGTRFRPLSLDTPKPLFPVAGFPMVWHHVKALSRVEGLKEILLIGFYEASVFEQFVKEAMSEFKAITIRYLREYQALGTAGGLYHFRDELTRGDPKQIFVLHADVCCSFPLQELKTFHEKKKALCTILGTDVDVDIARSFGCIVSDPDTHEVLHYVEKPESFISNLINCGVYLLDKAIFDEIKKAMQKKYEEPRNLTDFESEKDNRLRLEQDVLGPLAGSKMLFVYVTKDFWTQIKTAGSAVPANALYLKQYSKDDPSLLTEKSPNTAEIVEPVYTHPSARVDPSAKIGPNVSIGPGVIIGYGVRIKDSIILDNVELKANASVLHSIVGWDSKIGSWSRVEGSPFGSTASPTAVTENGVKVQSITILAKDVTVRDELIIRNCIVLPHKDLKHSCHNEVLL